MKSFAQNKEQWFFNFRLYQLVLIGLRNLHFKYYFKCLLQVVLVQSTLRKFLIHAVREGVLCGEEGRVLDDAEKEITQTVWPPHKCLQISNPAQPGPGLISGSILIQSSSSVLSALTTNRYVFLCTVVLASHVWLWVSGLGDMGSNQYWSTGEHLLC